MLVDLGASALALTAIIGLIVLVSRLRPVKWLWRHVVSDPLASWFRDQVREEVQVATKPLEVRLGSIEANLSPNAGKSLRDRVDQISSHLGLPPAFDASVPDEGRD